MDEIVYFAYGSNMSSKRLLARVPSAIPAGVGTLSGHRLEFSRPSPLDGSGKCDIAASPGDTVQGALFRIDPHDKAALDHVEGAEHGWAETWIEVIDVTGAALTVLSYRATRTRPERKPYTWYLQHVLAGARELGLARAYIEMIEQVNAVCDPDREREARELAIYR